MSRVATPRRPLKRARTFMPVPWERRVRARTAVASARARAARAGELKFYDVVVDDAVIDAAGTIQDPTNPGPAAAQESIVGIKQGVGESERIGRKCTIRSIGWRFDVSLPEQDAVTTPASGDVVRVILYHDKQANGAAATVLGILETANYQSFNNLSNTSRFTTLMDKTVAINYKSLGSDGAGVVSQGNVLSQYSFFKRCNIPLEFSAATGALSEIRSNNLNVMLISRAGIAGFASQFRVRFSDD